MDIVSKMLNPLRKTLVRRQKRAAKNLAYRGCGTPTCSAAALQSAVNIRGQHGPSVMIYGVMPRSGTVMVGELLRLHPALTAYPNDLWEIPFLAESAHLESFSGAFFGNYGQNRERMEDGDLPALFGAAFMRYLLDHVPSGQRLLIKEAGCRYLFKLPLYFPSEQVLLLMRDGRDIVHSSLRTWPGMDFKEVCREWAMSTNTMLDYAQQINDVKKAWLVRYEDVLTDQAGFVRQACDIFNLDPEQYDFDQIDQVRVIGSSTLSAGDQVDWAQHMEKPKNFNPSQHWKNWSASEKQDFKRIAGAALIQSGYEIDNSW